MDLIYTNSLHEDEGVLHDFSFDLAFGADENDFELTVNSQKGCCEKNSLVYIEGTEYGGIVDGMKVSTKNDSLVYNGRTWHGILASKIIEPDANEPHLLVSGEANSVVSSIIERVGLSRMFAASAEDSGLTIAAYTMDRYIDAYSGIQKMLATVSGKLKFTYRDGKVVLTALPLVDYSQDEQFDSTQVEMDVSKSFNPINHLICLGKGELTERQVIHLYADTKGNISETQSLFGIDERTAVYDYSSAESEEVLKSKGIEKLLEYASGGSAKMNFDTESNMYDVGDIVGTREVITNTFVKEKITKKIVSIDKGNTNIEYKVGG